MKDVQERESEGVLLQHMDAVKMEGLRLKALTDMGVRRPVVLYLIMDVAQMAEHSPVVRDMKVAEEAIVVTQDMDAVLMEFRSPWEKTTLVVKLIWVVKHRLMVAVRTR